MNRPSALQAHAGSLPAFAETVYFFFKTFSCKAQIVAVNISIYGISNMNFQHIRTSLCTTGFGFPLPLSLTSSAVAEVQTGSVTGRITWAGKAEAGFQHTHCLVHHLSRPAPQQRDRALLPIAVVQLPPPAPPRLWPVRDKRK